MEFRKFKGIAVLGLPVIFLFGCATPNPNPQASYKERENSLMLAYDRVINEKCHFHTIRDWLFYGYAISPYSYKEKFYKLMQTRPSKCLDTPINDFDRGMLTGSLADKEESCLGFTNLSDKDRYEIARKLYRFLKQKIQQICYGEK
jgi:hypothetical protein